MSRRVQDYRCAEVTSQRFVLSRMVIRILAWWPEAVLVLAAFFTSAQMPEVTAYWCGLGLRWGVASWGIGGSGLPHFLRVFDLIPSVAIALAVGAIIGLMANRRPIRLAMLYGAVTSVMSYLLLSAVMSRGEILCNIALAPLPAAAAQLVRLFLKTRRTEKYGVHCMKCGYSLHGNVSGICPECGTEKGGTEKTAMRELGGTEKTEKKTEKGMSPINNP